MSQPTLPAPQITVEEKIVDPNGDLEVTVIEYKKNQLYYSTYDVEVNTSGSQTPHPIKSATFRVNAEIVKNGFPVINMMLRPVGGGMIGFKESGASKITLEEDSVMAMEILFKIFHSCTDETNVQADIEEIWNVAAAVDKYGVDVKNKLIRVFYGQWYKSLQPKFESSPSYQKSNIAQQLLFPCFTFNHAPGFLGITKHLVYSTAGHVVESNPSRHRRIHLRPRVMQQLNAAKGRVRVILQRELFKPVEELLQNKTGDCCTATVFNYQKALYDLRVWPLELRANRMSLEDIFGRLAAFKYTCPSSDCVRCSKDYVLIVRDAIREAKTYYDGLCLDCMDVDKTKLVSHDDSDSDYNHYHKSFKYSEGCRVTHGEPTWYFSYMGRREKQGMAV